MWHCRGGKNESSSEVQFVQDRIVSLGICQIRPGGFFIDRDSVKVLGALKVEVDQAA